MNILIVDDNKAGRHFLSSLLKNAGHTAAAASNGTEGLDRLRSEPFDLIVSDILMPVMDGFQFCRSLKTDESLRHIPFIFYTATYTEAEDEVFAAKIGADRFIQKPCEPEQLLATISEVMASAKKQETSASPEKTPAPESEISKLYSERLVCKLEQKTGQLEKEVTARRRAEEVALTAADNWQIIFDAVLDPIMLLATDGTIWQCNRAFTKFIGEKPEALIGKKCFQVVHQDEKAVPECPRLRSLHTQSRESMELAIGERIFLVITDPIWDKQGNISGFVHLMRDITELKQKEAALRQSEEKFKYIFENSLIGKSFTLPSGKLQPNQALCDMLGHTQPETNNLYWQDITHPDDLASSHEVVDEILSGAKDSAQFIKRYRHRDGSVVWAEVSTILRRDEDNSPLYFMTAVNNITRRKQAEMEKDKLQAQLAHSQKMESVGRLAGGVAHDYNNMLNVIIGYAEMAMEKINPSDPLYADLTEIFNAAVQSADITKKLLAFARKQTISPQILDLNKTMEATLKMLRRLIGENIELQWKPDAGTLPVKVDPAQLDQILANLCVNARDAIAGVGTITIETDSVFFDEAYCSDHAGFMPGDYVLLAVSDDGCGMDKSIQDQIFEPFFTTKDMNRGTGLGLAMVYGSIEQSDGFINVYSEPGKGTTFKLYFPKHAGPAAEDKSTGTEELPVGRGETVLVVEDEMAFLKLITSVLDRLEYDVLFAASPSEALALAEGRAGPIHLLITDVIMPEMNGQTLAGHLQSLFPDIKVLFMSGYTARVIAHRGILEEGTHFIQKPFFRKDLAVKIREVLKQ